MNCSCGRPARFIAGREGKVLFVCPLGRCRFCALAAVQCEGYNRVIVNASTPAHAVVVYFEALLNPLHGKKNASEDQGTAAEAAVMARVQGSLEECEEARAVLEHTDFDPMWYPNRDAYLYPMEHYRAIVARLRALPQVLVEEVPAFFFSVLQQMQREAARHAEELAQGRADPIDCEDIVFTQLKAFQKRGVEYVVEHGGRAMIADDMGLGKTVQAIAVAHHYRSKWPVLVVCPMSLTENWVKEFNVFCGIPFSRMTVLQGSTKPQTMTSLHDVVVVSYASLKAVGEHTFNVVILDESHYIKAGDSKRTQMALKICRAARHVLLLSGTPAMSRPMELYTQLQAIHPTLVPTKTQYGARYCNAYVSRFGVDTSGHSHIDELHFLLCHFLLRRTKKEVSEAELPAKTRQLLYVCITAKEKKALEKHVQALRRSMVPPPSSGGGESGGGMAWGVDYTARAPNALELKVATARAKIPAVQDYVASMVEQHLDHQEKVIFFAHHQCMMEAIKKAIEGVRPAQPVDYIYISGDTPAAQREQLIHHFRTAPTCVVAILSMQSSGTGHNFTCAATVVFAELDWNPSTHLQCEDRVHRIGQDSPCTIKYLLAEGTTDSVIWPLLQAKLVVTSTLLENNAESMESYPLNKGADRQKVSRRNMSPVSSTQGTLDGFLRSSQRGCSVSNPRSTGSINGIATTNTTPSRSTAEPPHTRLDEMNGRHSCRSNDDPNDTAPLVLSCSPSKTPSTALTPTPAVPHSSPPVLITLEELHRRRAQQKQGGGTYKSPDTGRLSASLADAHTSPFKPHAPGVTGSGCAVAPVSVLGLMHCAASVTATDSTTTAALPTAAAARTLAQTAVSMPTAAAPRRTTFAFKPNPAVPSPPYVPAPSAGSGQPAAAPSAPRSMHCDPSPSPAPDTAALPTPHTLARIPLDFKRRLTTDETASLSPAAVKRLAVEPSSGDRYAATTAAATLALTAPVGLCTAPRPSPPDTRQRRTTFVLRSGNNAGA